MSVVLVLLLAGCGTAGLSATSVDPDDVGNPALKRIVSGLRARGIAVLAAGVEEEVPLGLSISVYTGSSSGDPHCVEALAEREVAVEWQRDRQPSHMTIQAVNTKGRVVFAHGIPLTSQYFTDLPAARLTTAAAEQLIAAEARSLIRSPFTIASLDLTDDVLGARLLHVRISTSDFEGNEGAYVQAFTDLENKVDELNLTQGTAVGVEWMEAVDEQGRMLYSSWWDYQLNMSTNHPGLVTDFRPRFFPDAPRSDWGKPPPAS